jgi:hypothetical protein
MPSDFNTLESKSLSESEMTFEVAEYIAHPLLRLRINTNPQRKCLEIMESQKRTTSQILHEKTPFRGETTPALAPRHHPMPRHTPRHHPLFVVFDHDDLGG